MKLSVRILFNGPSGPEWHARKYVHRAQMAGVRPSLMTSIYPGDCESGLEQVTQALRWLMERQPLVLAFLLETEDGFTHEERRQEVAA